MVESKSTIATPNGHCAPWHRVANYLFAGSDAGGERAAATYSLRGSTKLNGLNPQVLTYVPERIAEHPIAAALKRVSHTHKTLRGCLTHG